MGSERRFLQHGFLGLIRGWLGKEAKMSAFLGENFYSALIGKDSTVMGPERKPSSVTCFLAGKEGQGPELFG